MKRLIAIALMSLFGFAFGCGGAQEAPATAETADEAAVADDGMAEEGAAEEGAADDAMADEGAAEEGAGEAEADAPAE